MRTFAIPAARALMVLAAAVLIGSPAWGEKLDEGLLDPGWFGGEGVEFRRTDEIDYLWVKPGFNLAGRTLHIDAWDDPVMLAKKSATPRTRPRPRN